MKHTQPASLNSRAIRSILSGSNLSEFGHIYLAVDKLGGLHEALEKMVKNPDPKMTKEAYALKYRDRYKLATAAAKDAVLSAAKRLDDLERRLRFDAETKVGLNSPLSEVSAQEIRAALRGMSQKERDQVVKDAALNGDATILKAVRDCASPILTGAITVPVSALIQQLVESATPELSDHLEEINYATKGLQYASDTFFKQADVMRDPYAEAVADKLAEGAQEAEQAFAAAMSNETSSQ